MNSSFAEPSSDRQPLGGDGGINDDSEDSTDDGETSSSMSAQNGRDAEDEHQSNGNNTNGDSPQTMVANSRDYSMKRYLSEPESISTVLAVQLLQEPDPKPHDENHSEPLFSEGTDEFAGEAEMETEEEETDEDMSDDEDDPS